MHREISDNQIYIGYDTSELEVLRRYIKKIPEKRNGFHCDVFGNMRVLS